MSVHLYMLICVCLWEGSKTEIVREWFQHRHDHLEERELEKKSNVTKEKFTPGRSYALKCNSHHSPVHLMDLNIPANYRPNPLHSA